jgi:hypothetical protein
MIPDQMHSMMQNVDLVYDVDLAPSSRCVVGSSVTKTLLLLPWTRVSSVSPFFLSQSEHASFRNRTLPVIAHIRIPCSPITRLTTTFPAVSSESSAVNTATSMAPTGRRHLELNCKGIIENGLEISNALLSSKACAKQPARWYFQVCRTPQLIRSSTNSTSQVFGMLRNRRARLTTRPSN